MVGPDLVSYSALLGGLRESMTVDLFKELRSDDERWWCLLPQNLVLQHDWLLKSHSVAKGLTSDELRPFLAAAVYLYSRSMQSVRHGDGFYAALTLRSLVERVCLLWTDSPSIPLKPADILADLECSDVKKRRHATQEMVAAAASEDSDVEFVYHDLLSRYFSHVSHFDLVQRQYSQELSPSDPEFRLRYVPFLLLHDVGERLGRWFDGFSTRHSLGLPRRTQGKAGFEYSIETFTRLAAMAFCEKHSPSTPFELRVLFTNLAEVKGKVGLTRLYRGGMEVYRYGLPEDAPNNADMAGFALFAIGKHNPKTVRVKRTDVGAKGERYEFSWPKTVEVCTFPLSMGARNIELGHGQPPPFIDYVTEFRRVLAR